MSAVQCNSREATTECLWSVTEYPGYCDAIHELTKDSAKLINLGQLLSWGIPAGFSELEGVLPASSWCLLRYSLCISPPVLFWESNVMQFLLEYNFQFLTLPMEKRVWKSQPGSALTDLSKGSLCNLIYPVWLELRWILEVFCSCFCLNIRYRGLPELGIKLFLAMGRLGEPHLWLLRQNVTWLRQRKLVSAKS